MQLARTNSRHQHHRSDADADPGSRDHHVDQLHRGDGHGDGIPDRPDGDHHVDSDAYLDPGHHDKPVHDDDGDDGVLPLPQQ